MKFYEIPTPSGPQFVATQLEAKAAGMKRPEIVEVPTDKESLMAYLNDLKAKAFNTLTVPVELPTAPVVTQQVSVAAQLIEQMDKPRQATKLFEHDDIVELIVDSKGFQLANYFAAVMEAAERVRRAVSSQPAG